MTTQHGSGHDIRAGSALLSVILLAVAPDPAFAVQSRGANATRCTARAETPRRVELADGRTVSVDVQSVALSGGSVMAVGRHAYVFPRDATPVSSPTLQDSIIGIHIDDRGNSALVSNPLRTRRVFSPHVAAARDGSFHVVFVTGADTAELQPILLDTASIWHARFVNGSWTAPERVAGARNALLLPESTAELLEHDGSLSFLYPFVDGRPGATDGGVVLLRWRNGVWYADTLRTNGAPPFVRALIAPGDQQLIGVIALSVPRRGRKPADELYIVRFDSTWRDVRRIGGDGRRPVALPVLATVGDAIVVSWISWRPMLQETSRIEWVRIDRGGRVVVGPIVGSGSATFPFEMVGVGDQYPLWLYHGEPSGNAVALAMASDTVIVRLGSLTTPFQNPKPKAIALSRARVLVFTMKQGKSDNEAMVASYTTAVEIRCPITAQR